jgi:hypothetical protein
MAQEPELAAQTRLMAATEPKELMNMSLPKLEEHYNSLQAFAGLMGLKDSVTRIVST